MWIIILCVCIERGYTVHTIGMLQMAEGSRLCWFDTFCTVKGIYGGSAGRGQVKLWDFNNKCTTPLKKISNWRGPREMGKNTNNAIESVEKENSILHQYFDCTIIINTYITVMWYIRRRGRLTTHHTGMLLITTSWFGIKFIANSSSTQYIESVCVACSCICLSNPYPIPR